MAHRPSPRNRYSGGKRPKGASSGKYGGGGGKKGGCSMAIPQVIGVTVMLLLRAAFRRS